MCVNDHITPVWSYGTSMRISGQGFAHVYREREARKSWSERGLIVSNSKHFTESIFFVLATRTESETSVVFAHSSVDTVAETFIEINSDRVGTADIEIDKETAVYVIRCGLEKVHERACKRETTIFGSDGQRGDMAVEIVRRALGFAYNYGKGK
jgi:hypothetical protein